MQNVRTRISGEVSSFAVAAGGAIELVGLATIRDTSVMLLAVDFPAAEAQSFVAGQAAQVMPDTTFETLNGLLRSVSGADPAKRRQPDDLHRHHRCSQRGQPDHRTGRYGTGERRQLPQLCTLYLPA